MSYKTLHRTIGLILLVPILAWALTGFVFLTKPGYEGAYEQLAIKSYPVEQAFYIEPQGDWYEYRVVRTILGYHLLVRDGQGWSNLHLESLAVAGPLSNAQLKALIGDAMTQNPDRYGRIAALGPDGVKTDTGVVITLDWSSLSLQQVGTDTRFIGLLYKIHYLQWLGLPLLNNGLAIVGITLLLALSLFGWMLYLRSRKISS